MLVQYYRGQKLRPRWMPGGGRFWISRYQEEQLERTGRCGILPPLDPDRGGWDPEELLAAYAFTLDDPRGAQTRLAESAFTPGGGAERRSDVSRWLTPGTPQRKRGSAADKAIRRAINDRLDA